MKNVAAKRKGGFHLNSTPSVKAIKGIVAVLPGIFVILILNLLPALLNVGISFTDYNGDFSRMAFVGFDNYRVFFTIFRADILDAAYRTFLYMLLTILPIQVLSLFAALLVNAKIKGKSFFRAIFFLPTILGVSVVTTIWGIMFDPIDGSLTSIFNYLNNYLPFIPKDPAFLGSSKQAMYCVAFVAIWSSFGFSMTIYLAALQGVSSDYYEVAKIEGAGIFTTFFKITLPLIWPAITICLWLALSSALGMSDYIILLTGGGRNTTTIGFYIYNAAMNHTITEGQTAAVSIYFFFFITTVMLLFNKFIRKREVEL